MRPTIVIWMLVILAGQLAPAQAEQWSRLGSYGIQAGLAGAAGGEAADVAFAADGRTIVVRVSSGELLTSTDGGETWTPSSGYIQLINLARERESSAGPNETVYRHPYRAGVLYALGRELKVSFDDGLTWVVLAGNGQSMIGSDQDSIAFDPLNPDRVYVANRFGLWRSSDGGLTWYGLNDRLPNFPEVRFETGPRGGAPALRSDALGGLAYSVGLGAWRRAPLETGPAADGERSSAIWQSPTNPDVFVVAAGGATGSRLFRSLDAGATWDDLTADLPDGELRAVTASSETGAVYVAGQMGVFYAASDLERPAPATPWTEVTGDLPSSEIRDLYLETASGRLYAATSGEGVFRRRAPDVAGRLRALNAADLSLRPTAPGGLVTVQGAAVESALVGRDAAPVLAATATEAQIQVPFESSGDSVSMALTTDAGMQSVRMPLQAVSPAIFIDDGLPLVLSAGTGRLLDLSRPARGGDRLLILASGLGRVEPAWPTGTPAPLENPPRPVAAVSATLNGKPLRVVTASLAGGYVGAYFVEVELPAELNAGSAELQITAAGAASNTVRIFVQP